jgi:hypothetical protein
VWSISRNNPRAVYIRAESECGFVGIFIPVKEQAMEFLYSILGWGSPLGIALFFFFSGVGSGVFLWGVSLLKNSNEKIIIK